MENMNGILLLLQRWVEAEPDNIIGNYKLGSALFAVGQKAESLIYLERAFTHFSVGMDRYTTIPFLHVFVINYYNRLLSTGKMEKAEIIEQIIASVRENCHHLCSF